MIIKHIWSVLCRESIINQDDNVISLFGVLEELNTTITPNESSLSKPAKIVIPFNFEIVNYWTKDIAKEVKMQVKTDTIDPEGKELASIVNESIFPDTMKKLRSRLKIQGITFTKTGIYTFKVSLKVNDEKEYKIVAELPLTVNIKLEKKAVPARN